MIDYLEQNLGYLRSLDQDLAARVEKASRPKGAQVIDAKNGQPTLVVENITFHSRMDPGAEGVKMAGAALEAAAKAGKVPGFFGVGLGWHVLALARQVERVIVVEPDPGMLRLALTCLDFRPLISKIRWAVTTDDLESPDDLVLVPHPPTVRAHPAAYREWSRFFEQAMESPEESAGELSDRLGGIPGASALLSGLERHGRIGLDDLVRLVQKQKTPRTETEIYILLLKELQL